MSNEFELEKRYVSTAELDAAIKELKEANDNYDKVKAVSTEAFHLCEKLESKMVALLDAAGKSKYECEGIAAVSVSLKASVTTPKTPEEKQRLFDFLERKFGHDGLMAYQSVNSQTLNSLYNKEMAESVEKGIEFEMGNVLALPTLKKTLSMRAKTSRSK